jgi:hypothetical protein
MDVFSEWRVILNCWTAFKTIPRTRDERTNIVFQKDRFVIKSLSKSRAVFVTTILTIRVVILLFLLYLGGMFLATEANVPNLLLNTIALDFVVHVDQLVFQSFAADTSISFISRLKPIGFGTWRTTVGIDAKSVCLSFFGIGYTVLFYLLIVDPMKTNMTKVIEALCDDLLQFAIATDSYGFVYVNAYSNSQYTVFGEMARESVRRAMQSTVAAIDSSVYRTDFSLNPSLVGFTLSEMKAMGQDNLVDLYNSNCDDLLQDQRRTVFDFGAYVRVAIKPSITTCSDMLYACFANSLAGNIARWVCPRTCTCDTPFSATFSQLAHNGCPTACQRKWEYSSSITHAKCVDWTRDELIASAFWSNWTGFLKSNQRTLIYGNSLEQYGCDSLIQESIWNGSGTATIDQFCDGTYLAPFSIRPLATVCPQTCRCNGTFSSANISALAFACPGTCPPIRRYLGLSVD